MEAIAIPTTESQLEPGHVETVRGYVRASTAKATFAAYH